MGIIADIFVSTPQDADTYDDLAISGEELPGDRFERVEFKGFTPLEFGTLWAILERRDWDESQHQLEHIAHRDEGESWLERFPPALVELLAGLSDQKLEETSVVWGQTEELECDGPQLVPVLQGLRKLARSAVANHRSMYLWGSL